MSGDPRRRELRARGLGVAVGLAAMLAATLAIGWPAPGVSAALGLAAYLWARRRRPADARERRRGQGADRWLG